MNTGQNRFRKRDGSGRQDSRGCGPRVMGDGMSMDGIQNLDSQVPCRLNLMTEGAPGSEQGQIPNQGPGQGQVPYGGQGKGQGQDNCGRGQGQGNCNRGGQGQGQGNGGRGRGQGRRDGSCGR